MGGSGSGKSTIMRLFYRFYDPWEGEVRVGGEDVRGYDLDDLRKEVGVVPQVFFLFFIFYFLFFIFYFLFFIFYFLFFIFYFLFFIFLFCFLQEKNLKKLKSPNQQKNRTLSSSTIQLNTTSPMEEKVQTQQEKKLKE